MRRTNEFLVEKWAIYNHYNSKYFRAFASSDQTGAFEWKHKPYNARLLDTRLEAESVIVLILDLAGKEENIMLEPRKVYVNQKTN